MTEVGYPYLPHLPSPCPPRLFVRDPGDRPGSAPTSILLPTHVAKSALVGTLRKIRSAWAGHPGVAVETLGTGSVGCTGALRAPDLIEEKAGGQRPPRQQNQTEPLPDVTRS